MVEEYAATGVEAVGFAIVDGDPMGIEFRSAIGGSWVEGRLLGLRSLTHATKQLRGRSLVEARALLQVQNANRLKDAQSADGISIGGIFWGFE
jgi:hypothetical protein